MRMTVTDFISQYAPCEEARVFLSQYADMSEAWENCARPDWLFWALEKVAPLDARTNRVLACRFVRETPLADGRKVWDLLTDARSRKVVEVAEAHTRGEATDAELKDARDAAWDAWDATGAAWVAARVAGAAWEAAREAAARVAAGVVWEAAAWAAGDAARLAQCRIIREVVANPFTE